MYQLAAPDGNAYGEEPWTRSRPLAVLAAITGNVRENVPPGYGGHTIEYRAIDAAGNVGRTTRIKVVLRKAG